MMRPRRVAESLGLTAFVFGLLGWVYIVLVRFISPSTLTIQLTHLTPWLREDTFGILSFIASLCGFFVWNLLRKD